MKIRFSFFWCFAVLLFINHKLRAQDSLRYIAANEFVMIGKAKPTKQPYLRIDSQDTRDMTKPVQELAKNSAGIAIIFETNSAVIAAKWTLAEDRYQANMTPIAHSGLDLYCLKDGKWQYVSVARPAKGTTRQKQVIIQRMDATMKQFMLYLPLYNTVQDLAIGVDKRAMIISPKNVGINQNKRVVVYGSSIVQGSSASRAGMAYPSILQRKLGIDVVNLGFSGNAKMEIEVARYLAGLAADCYVLDCIPNQTPQQVSDRAIPFIRYLHAQKPNIPIILVESVVREHGYFDRSVGDNVSKQNDNIRIAYEQLKKEKCKNLYYIPASAFMGTDHEGTIDGTHLTDVGFNRIAAAILKVLKKAI